MNTDHYDSMWKILIPHLDIEQTVPDLSILRTLDPTRSAATLIIPGFGLPALDQKFRWLHHNVSQIRRTLPEVWPLHIVVSCYSREADDGFSVAVLPRFPRTVWFVRQAADLIGSFLRNHLNPDVLWGIPPLQTEGHRPVFLLLDDVEIRSPLDASLLFRRMLLEDLHILSPTLDRRSVSGHKFMFRLWPKTSPPVLRRTNYAELFFYIMTLEGYRRWHALLLPQSRFLWGIDLVLFPNRFRIGIDESVCIRHYFSSKLDRSPHYRAMQEELRKYTRLFPDHIAFRFKNLCVTRLDHRTGRAVILTDRVEINPRYEKIDRLPSE